MGHQLRFCITANDALELQHRLEKLAPMHVLHSRSPSREPRIVDSLDFSEAGQRWLSFFLVRVDDLASVVTQHVPAQGYWTIDELRSPVVECELTYVDDRVMRGGRLHCFDGFYGRTGEWSEKPESFRRWARALLRAARAMLAKQDDLYIGADARRDLERNNKLIERM